MKTRFEKHETLFCILLIIVYLILNSFCQQRFGIAAPATVLLNTLFSLLLLALILALKRFGYYGLTKAENIKRYLYFLPLLPVATVNLWNSINTEIPASTAVLHILTMINIGFIEEVVFRGFLFKMMERANLKVAILVNALSFGFGHIINLLGGAEVVATLLQICCATAIGYLFVIIFYRSRSIVPCIITHIAINATSVFAVESEILTYVTSAVTVVWALAYAIYINRRAKKQPSEN